MVYLTRTQLIRESKWGEAVEFAIKARDYIRKDPLVVKADLLGGINGTLNRTYFVVAFNNLADEEKWAEKTGTDPEYQAFLEGTVATAVENSTVDNLYRTLGD